MRAIIIDDEQKGREILQKLLNDYCKTVEIVAIACNATEAYELIIKHKPQVIFLDIEMPNGSGFSLLEKFDTTNFEIIVTTAYDDYAIRAIKHHAFDYLLKPIDIDELVFAVDSIKKHLQASHPEIQETSIMPSAKINYSSRLALPIKEGLFYLSVSDIVRIESDGGYSIFYTSDGKKYMVSKNLKEYEDVLPEKEFLRIHKSHIINVKKVVKYIRTDGNYIEMIDGSVVEISRRKKDEFLQIMSEIK